jgi:site-specific DNA-methyltransferase (adenine-specific)
MAVTLHHSDCLEVLRDMAGDSVDSIVTDPPYGLSFMGRKWDYDVPTLEVWAECLRVLKPGGHLLAFAGTRTQHRMACRIEDGGFEIRDMLAWLYGSGFPKHGNALKPALEPITLARKPLRGSVAANVATHGTGGLNIDGCRVPLIEGEAPAGSGDRRGSAVYAQDEWTRTQMENGGNATPDAGRWPANLLHDGSPEVVALFPGEGDKSAARFFYCSKANRKDRDEGLDGFEVKRTGGMQATADGSMLTGSGNERTTSRDNSHPTVKPTDLMRYLCRLVTPPGGIVLDPFMGSGSTGKAAALEGFGFIGIEREAEYVKIARARISAAQP